MQTATSIAAMFPPADYRLAHHQLTPDGLLQLLADAGPFVATASMDPAFLYRGQRRRHTATWPPEPSTLLGLQAESYQIESLFPTDARLLGDLIRAGRKHEPLVQLTFGDGVWQLRSILVAYAALQWANHSNIQLPVATFQAWLYDQQHQPWDKMLSVGQHTGDLPTHVLDATSSLYVALWFATHAGGSSFDNNAGQAVLYRIARPQLQQAEVICAQALSATEFHHVYCHDAPPELTARPSLQHGWSLCGWDRPWVQCAALANVPTTIELYVLPDPLPPEVVAMLQAMPDLLPLDPLPVLMDNILAHNSYLQDFVQWAHQLPQPPTWLSALPPVASPSVQTAVRHGWQGP